MVGRRGETLALEAIIGLVMVIVVGGVFLMFASAKIDGRSYFAEFHTKDLAMLGDLAVASPGQLTVTYDNLRPLGFTFSFGDGMVETQIASLLSEKETYGYYSDLQTAETSYENPYYLVFLKQGDTLAVKEAAGYLKECTITRPSISRDDLKLAITGGDFEFETGLHSIISQVLPDAKTDESAPNLRITVASGGGADNILITRTRNDLALDAAYLSCVMKSLFEGFSELPVTEREVPGPAGVLDLQVQVSQQAGNLDNRTLGRIIGQGVTIYAR